MLQSRDRTTRAVRTSRKSRYLTIILALLVVGILSGCSSSPGISGITPTPPVPAVQTPPAPNSITVTTADTQNTVNWAAVSTATSYNLYWSNSAGVTPSTGTKIGSLTAPPYVHTALTNGTMYYYVVTAVNEAGESTPSTQASGMPLPAGTIGIPLTPGTPTSGTLNANSTTTLSFSFDGQEVTTAGTAYVSPLAESALGTPLPAVKKTSPAVHKAAALAPLDAGCTYIAGFQMTTAPTTITSFATPATLGGAVDPTTPTGSTLNIAVLQSSTWYSVITMVVGTNGALTQNLPSVTLPGVLAPGKYVVCKPKLTTSVSNLGVALIADDGNGSGQSYEAVQVVHVYDSKGNVLATPTVDYLSYDGASDLDGQALTPDASQGILVDGGNTVRFFSKLQTGTPVPSDTTLDVSAYGGDGDSIAIMPDGNEAIVSADGYQTLLLVSGIVAGTPVATDIITVPGYRDGLVVSNDGTVMLARGYDGVTVFAVAPITPHPGSIGGTVSHSFTQVKDFPDLGNDWTEDGRDAMAMSPVDSSRAVVLIPGAGTIQLLTGLPANPVAAATLDVSSAQHPAAVSITPDGKTAIVGGYSGLLMISGVDTGNLAIVGSLYAPTYTLSGNSVTLGEVTTLGITLDGKYVVVCDRTNSALLVAPISPTGVGAPVGIVGNIAVPDNDQMLIH